MSHMTRPHHQQARLQFDHDLFWLTRGPNPLNVPDFHSDMPVHKDEPFYVFEPVAFGFKERCAEVATEVLRFDEADPDQFLINLWQASDTLEEFVDHLASHIDVPDHALVAVAHAFESSIAQGLDQWEEAKSINPFL